MPVRLPVQSPVCASKDACHASCGRSSVLICRGGSWPPRDRPWGGRFDGNRCLRRLCYYSDADGLRDANPAYDRACGGVRELVPSDGCNSRRITLAGERLNDRRLNGRERAATDLTQPSPLFLLPDATPTVAPTFLSCTSQGLSAPCEAPKHSQFLARQAPRLPPAHTNSLLDVVRWHARVLAKSCVRCRGSSREPRPVSESIPVSRILGSLFRLA